MKELACPHHHIEANLMYVTPTELDTLGRFDLIWCTGVLYHNAEQLRFVRRLYKLLDIGGWLMPESSTLCNPCELREGRYVEIHFPRTYRDTGTVTHLLTTGTVKTWLGMAGISDVLDSRCFEKDNRDLVGLRTAWLARKTGEDEDRLYYAKSDLNSAYKLVDST